MKHAEECAMPATLLKHLQRGLPHILHRGILPHAGTPMLAAIEAGTLPASKCAPLPDSADVPLHFRGTVASTKGTPVFPPCCLHLMDSATNPRPPSYIT